MAWSLWKRSLITMLACAAVVCAQEPPSPSTHAPTNKSEEKAGRIVTIQEAGKPACRCTVLKSWRTSEGTRAYQVKAQDTGELMTIVENGPDKIVTGSQPGPRVHAITMRIFHWGQSSTPPQGCPVPPDEVVIVPEPARGSIPPSACSPTSTTDRLAAGPDLPATKPALSAQSTIALTRPFPAAPGAASPAAPAIPYTSSPVPSQGSNYSMISSSRSCTDTTTDPKFVIQGNQGIQACEPKPVVPASFQSNTVSTNCGSTDVGMNMHPAPAAASNPAIASPVAGSSSLAPDGKGTTKTPYCATTAAQASASPATPAVASPASTQWRPAGASQGVTKGVASKTAGQEVIVKADASSVADKQSDPLQDPTGYTHLPKEMVQNQVYSAPDPDHRSWFARWKEQRELAKASQTASEVIIQTPLTSELSKAPTEVVEIQAGESKGGLRRIFSRAPKTTEIVNQMETEVQGESQAGEIPIPPVALPDTHRAPKPPAPFANPGFSYSGYASSFAPPAIPSAASTRTDSPMVNAFTPAPQKEAVAGVANAFSPGQPSVPKINLPPSATPSGPKDTEAAMVAHFSLPQTSTMPAVLPPTLTQPDNPNLQAVSVPVRVPDQPNSANMLHQLSVLKDSMYPSQREWAAGSLCSADWHTQPQVLRALITASREDPAATVRAACIRCIVKMQANTPEVVSTLRGLKNDGDPRVKLEVEVALPALAALPSTGTSHVVSPH